MAFAAFAGATAQAATVLEFCCPPGVGFFAGPGERNTVTWTSDSPDYLNPLGGRVVIADATANVKAGNQCSQLGPRAVLCDEWQGQIYLGDGDDFFSPVTSNDNGDRYRGPQFWVDGGPGNDRLVSGGVLSNGGASLYGGDGNDVLIQRGLQWAGGGPGNDRIVLTAGYSRYDANLMCGAGYDTVIAPKRDPLPADCEKQILLPSVLGG